MHGGTWRATTVPSRGNKLFPTATYLFFKLLMIDQDFPHRLIPALELANELRFLLNLLCSNSCKLNLVETYFCV